MTRAGLQRILRIPARRFPPPWSNPSFPFLRGFLAGLGVDEMNLRASGARHGFVNLAICRVIGNNPALHLQTSSWAAVGEGNIHSPAIWEQRRSMVLLIWANTLFACANFARDEARRIAANIAKLPDATAASCNRTSNSR
jgi:hypothetical protein